MLRKALLAALVVTLCASSPLWAGKPGLGQNGDFNGWLPFTPNSPWNKDISAEPVDPLSGSIVALMGVNTSLHPDFGTTWGIPYYVVSGSQRKVKVTNTAYQTESDNLMMPLPPTGLIEGNGAGDAHFLVLDRDNYLIYELYHTSRTDNGRKYSCGGCAIFNGNSSTLRPNYWTSSDAAGMSVLAGLVRYQEVYVDKVIKHAIRCQSDYTRKAFLPPATHWASSYTGTQYPPMGCRFRLKASFNTAGYSGGAKVIVEALKKYGMIMSDNGGMWFITGAGPDSRWNDPEINTLKNVHGRDFEVVKMNGLVAASAAPALSPIAPTPTLTQTLEATTKPAATSAPSGFWRSPPK